jgi:hypothetical protein
MKSLQTGTFRNVGARGFWFRREVRVLEAAKSVRTGAPANTRILNAPTHGRKATRVQSFLDAQQALEAAGLRG